MPTKRLTETTIKALKPSDKRVDYFDTKDWKFAVRVFPSGAKTFFVFYRHHGRMRRYSIGSANLLKVDEARKQAKRVLAQVELGRDPASEKQEVKMAESFAELADAYLEQHAKRKKRSWREDERVINNELLPAWRNKKAKDIRPVDVSTLLERIVARGAPIMANRTLEIVRKMFGWGYKKSLVDSNPCARLDKPSEEHIRERVLNDDEIRPIWRAIDGDSWVAEILRLTLMLGQRPGEVANMRWEDINLEKRTWTIGGADYKNKRPHVVPLSEMALRKLKEIKESYGGSLWVFPSPHASKGPVVNYDKCMARLRKTADIDHWTAHDLRTTATTKMAEIGVPSFEVDRVLGHKLPGVIKHYNMYDYFPQKKRALDKWADELERIVSGKTRAADVVTFPSVGG